MVATRAELAERIRRFLADYDSLLVDLEGANTLAQGEDAPAGDDSSLSAVLDRLVMTGTHRLLAFELLAKIDLPRALHVFNQLCVHPKDLDHSRLSDVGDIWIMISDLVEVHGEETIRQRLRAMLAPARAKVDPRLWEAIAEGFDRELSEVDTETWLFEEVEPRP